MRKIKLALLVFGVVLLLAAVIVFVFRNSILQNIFTSVQAMAKARYNLTITAKDVGFTSLTKVSFNDLVVLPQNADTLLIIDSCEVGISLARVFIGQVTLKSINLNGLRLNIINHPDSSNINFAATDSTSKPSATSSNKDPLFARAIKKVNQLAGIALTIKDAEVFYADTALQEKVIIPAFEFDTKVLNATILNPLEHDSLKLSGNVNLDDNHINIDIQSTKNTPYHIPFVKIADGLQCAFNSLKANIKWQQKNDHLNLTTDVQFQNWQAEHWRIAAERVIFPYIDFKGDIKVNANSITLDSNTIVRLSNLPLKLFAYVSKQDTNIVAALNIDMQEVDADTFFNCLPQGMFRTIKGISCGGKLGYRLRFLADTQNLDSLVFESSMPRKNFTLKHYGAENYSRINDEFVYDAYVKDVKVREILVGHNNSHFVSLRQVSPFLIQSVLHSEDPSFMRHNGFLESAFRESIIQNIREKRFARGGSTITMQLVKNVYLNRDKNIARKLEEALIVYLIETLNLVSKERMLEVYLNVIEWGPGVFGIGEAAEFYFKKKPSELNLQESIFLAGIIPNPRVFKYHFTKEGALRPHFTRYYQVLSNRMVVKGVINPQDTVGVLQPLQLKGAAKNLVLPEETPAQEPEMAF